MRRLGVIVMGVLWVAPVAALAQTPAPTLVLSAPANGSTTGPDVTVVVGLSGAADQAVTFTVLLDDAPAVLENPGNGQTSRTSRVSSGGRAALILRGVPEGTHTVQAVAVPAGSAAASATSTFEVSARGFNLALLLASLAVIVVFVLYRRRVLGPISDRYERRSRESGPSDEG